MAARIRSTLTSTESMGLWSALASFDNLFSTRDPEKHKKIKVPVSQKFSMISIRQFEPMADECCALFVSAMHELQSQNVDRGLGSNGSTLTFFSLVSYCRPEPLAPDLAQAFLLLATHMKIVLIFN
jgi:hypothetical protein